MHRACTLFVLVLAAGCKATDPDTATPATELPPTVLPPTTPGPEDCSIPVDWNVATDQTLVALCSPYIVPGDIEIHSGATLSIEPGVVIQMPFDSTVSVLDGILDAAGTPEDPIVFTSSEASPLPGSWGGVQLGAATQSGTRLSNVILEWGGQDTVQEACLVALATRPTLELTNVTFRECQGGGLRSDTDEFLVATGLSFQDIDGYGLSVPANAVGTLTETFSYANVPYNRIEAPTVRDTATWVAQEVPWHVGSDIFVEGIDNPVLTLQAGVVLRFATFGELSVGDSESGGLVTEGTPDAPVVFESTAPDPVAGSWRGLRIGPSVLSNSTLTGLFVHGGGETGDPDDEACVRVNAPTAGRLSIVDSTFEACSGAGVYVVDRDFRFDAFASNLFVGLSKGFNVPGQAMASVGDGHVFDATPSNTIRGALAIDSDGTWLAQGVPYDVQGDILVEGLNNPVLTLSSGIVLRFEIGGFIEIGNGGEPGGLVSLGTAAAPVVLESTSGGGSPGDWAGIRFGESTLAGSTQTHLTVRHAGQDVFQQRGCVEVRGSHQGRVSFVDSRFETCLGSGIHALDPSFSFGDFSGNVFEDLPVGIDVKANTIGSIGVAQTYSATPANRIDGGVVADTQTWVDQGVPFEVVDRIEVRGVNNPVLTIEAGSAFEFSGGERLNIGGSSTGGGLVVAGTADNRVTFGSRTPGNPGSWPGLYFTNDTLPGTEVAFAHIADAGESGSSQRAAITLFQVGTNVTLRDLTFADNAQADVWCDATLSSPVLTELLGAVVDCPAA